MAITKEQIIALIDAKIAGQGSAVDVGGALPAILKGLADMGISSDMSETEQMQARKGLGLYYEETGVGEKTASYTDEQEEPSGLWKISDDTPSKDDIVGVSVGGGDPTLADYELVDIEGGYVITLLNIDPKFQIIFEETGGKTPGIYCTSFGKFASLVYNGPTTVVSKVPEKYLPIVWNQLVTEGTKIAEVTIGEETTNVFAPEGGGGSVKEIESSFVAANSVNLTETYGITEEEFSQMKSGQIAFIKTSDGQLYSVICALSTQYINTLVLAKPYQFSEPQYLLIVGGVTNCNIRIVGEELVTLATPQSGTDLTDEQFYTALGITAAQFNSIVEGYVRSISFGMSMTCRVDIHGSNILSLGGGKIYAVKDANGWQLTVS